MIKVVHASFLTSATSNLDSIHEGTVEVAFLGRSNVGKSSLINALTNYKNLAKSSSTPGKTRLINFFEVIYLHEDIRKKVHFIDLPGFGYAKVSKTLKYEWQKSLTKFIASRLSLRLFILLIDARHPDLDLDNQVYEYLKSIQRGDQKIIKIYTKIDKLNQKEIFHLKKSYPESLHVSSVKKRGLQELNSIIYYTLIGENENGL